MALYMETGTIARALPTGDGLDVKLQRDEGGTLALEIAADRPDLMTTARAARMSGCRVTLRRTDAGLIVAMTSGAVAAAA